MHISTVLSFNVISSHKESSFSKPINFADVCNTFKMLKCRRFSCQNIIEDMRITIIHLPFYLRDDLFLMCDLLGKDFEYKATHHLIRIETVHLQYIHTYITYHNIEDLI